MATSQLVDHSPDLADHVWLFDLLDPRTELRRTALERYRTEIRQPRRRAADLVTLPDLIHRFQLARDPVVHHTYVGYALLYLRWEERFPGEWFHAGPWAPWGLKKEILAAFSRNVAPDAVRADLVELTLGAVRRPHRCEDRGYARIVRRIDCEALRAGLREALVSGDRVVRQRAGFLCQLLDDPDRPATVAGWRGWLGRQG